MSQKLRVLWRSICLISLLISFVNPAKSIARTIESAEISATYQSCGLKGILNEAAFASAFQRAALLDDFKGRIAIIDFTIPSSSQRLFIVDVVAHKLLYSGLVAHGKGSGELKAISFSNTPESHQSSIGLYRIGDRIISPKHGNALLLEGLEKGRNDNARSREIIIHAADYVSEEFVRTHGRLGRSYGCPAVSRNDIGTVINLLGKGDLLFIYAGAAS